MTAARAAALLLVLGVVLAACGGAPGSPGSPAESTLPSAAVTPYVDVTGDAIPDLGDVAARTGQRDFVLAFAVAAEGRCTPSWGGRIPLADPGVGARAASVRERGGQVVVATGGAEGPYLEQTCTSARALTDAYEQVLDAVGARTLDVDIEAAVPDDTVADALAALQHERATPISVTLPVADARTGLAPEGIALLRAIAARGVAVRVNAMAMNFAYEGDWSTAMTESGAAVARQLVDVWPGIDPAAVRRRVALTIMVGRNDTGPVTSPADASRVAADARSNGLGAVGLWSLARDNGGCPGAVVARPDCSGVDQEPFAFLRTLRSAYAS